MDTRMPRLPFSRPLGIAASTVAAALLALGAVAQPTAPEAAKADDAAERAIAEAEARADRLLEQGKFAEAAAPAREAADLTAQAYGPRHWRAFDADRRRRLAETARDGPADQRQRLAAAIGAEARAWGLDGSQPAEAQKLALRAAEGYAAVLGEQTPEHARAWHLVSRIQLARNDAKGAKEANQRALAIRRRALPEGHPAIAQSLNNLGNVQVELRDYAGARASFEQALAIRRQALPPDHPAIATILYNLGLVQVALRDYAGARASFEQALAIRRQVLPPDHPH